MGGSPILKVAEVPLNKNVDNSLPLWECELSTCFDIELTTCNPFDMIARMKGRV